MNESNKKLECPFTWSINTELISNFDKDEEPVIGVDEQPIQAMINSIMLTYVYSTQNNNQDALENLKVTEEIFQKADRQRIESEGISLDVLEHIKNATEYYLYKMNEYTNKMSIVSKNLQNADNLQSDIDKGTIYGCKAIAWSIFHEAGYKEALKSVNQAVSLSPNCPLWHLIQGKNLRHERRNVHNKLEITDKEKNAFLKCYDLSNDSFYRIHVAQMFRENKNNRRAEEIYQAIFASNPKSYGTLLRLARAFIVFNDFRKSDVCFQNAAKIQKNSMFFHYKGIFHEKQKNWKEAAINFKKAAEKGNYRADLQYANCMKKIDRNFQFIDHLKMMFEKYKKNIHFQQQILLHIAMQYGAKQEIEKSLTYFLKAIEFNSKSHQLKVFYNTTIDWQSYNVYNLVEERLRSYEVPPHMRSTVEKLKDFCKLHKANSTDEISTTLTALRI